MFAYTKLMQAMVAAGAVSATDPYFNLVTLLLPGNGTNGAQNNTFLDSSSNNFTITRNGNTTQGTFSPFSQTGWSNNFNADSTYLSFGSNDAFAFGTGAYTVEFWVYQTAAAAGGAATPIVTCDASSGFLLWLDGTTLSLGYWGAGGQVTVSTAISLNTWTHVAICRASTSSNQTSIFINGTRQVNGTNSQNYTVNGPFRVAGSTQTSNSLRAYISNLRVVKGTDVYGYSNTSITVPTAPLTAITNTSLLTCQSNRFIDNSSNAFAVTVTASPSVQAFSPFAPTATYSAATNGGSGYFDGTGDYLSIADSASLEPGSSDLTFEAWVYLTATPSAGGAVVISKSVSGGYGPFNFQVTSSKTVALLVSTTGSSWTTIQTSATINLNEWVYLAFTRSGTTFTVYINGVSSATGTVSGALVNNSESVMIGYGNSATTNVTGYIAGLRYVIGSANSISVPTSPPTNITNTSLLTNFTNAGITDATAKNDLETLGNASISTAQSKFGGGSMYFDGSTSYLTRPYSPLFALGNGNFTVECWVNTTQNANGNYPSVVGRWSNGNSWDLRHSAGDNSNKPTFAYNDGASNFNVLSTGGTIYDGAWHHLAAVRSGNTITLYVDGGNVGTSTFTGTIAAATSSPLTVANNSGGSLYYTGYIDDLRITVGYARYTANFTPTTVTFPLQ